MFHRRIELLVTHVPMKRAPKSCLDERMADVNVFNEHARHKPPIDVYILTFHSHIAGEDQHPREVPRLLSECFAGFRSIDAVQPDAYPTPREHYVNGIAIHHAHNTSRRAPANEVVWPLREQGVPE